MILTLIALHTITLTQMPANGVRVAPVTIKQQPILQKAYRTRQMQPTNVVGAFQYAYASTQGGDQAIQPSAGVRYVQ